MADDNTARAQLELPPATYSAPDRDPVITIDGCRIYLHIHDAEYMRQRAEWKRRLAAAHPDAGGSATDFRSILGQRMAWQRNEQLYYAKLGLFPPDGAGENTEGVHQRIRQAALDQQTARTRPLQLSDRRLAAPYRHSNHNRQRRRKEK